MMLSSYKNNFGYSDEDLLGTKNQALVVFVSMHGFEISILYPYITKHCGRRFWQNDLKIWDLHHRDLKPGQTLVVKNQVNEILNFEWIIYTVAPYYNNDTDWFALCDCYRNCLNAAAENGITSVTFPHIERRRMHFDPGENDLLYMPNVINETVRQLGGREKMNVAVLLPRRVYKYLIQLDDMLSGKAGTVMPLHKAKEWIQWFNANITNDIAADDDVFAAPLAEEEEKGLTYNVEEYVREYIKRAELTGDFIREHRRAACYESVVKKIQQEKEACLAVAIKKEPAADIDDVVKRFRCRKIDDMIQKWCDKPVPERERGKYGRRTNTRNALAKTVGLTSQTLSDITRKYKLPSRDTLLALAVGMKLPYEERLEFCLCRDENIKYPATEKEKLIERVLEETGYAESDMSFVSLNDEVYQRSGEKFSIYDVTEVNTKSVKTKDKKTKSETL